jgi:hypothetical protein
MFRVSWIVFRVSWIGNLVKSLNEVICVTNAQVHGKKNEITLIFIHEHVLE